MSNFKIGFNKQKILSPKNIFKKASEAFFFPNNPSRLRMIRSAPPLLINDVPMTEARAMSMPILPLVLPNATANRLPRAMPESSSAT